MPTISFNTSVEEYIEIYCAKCGTGLCGNSQAIPQTQSQPPAIQVYPCDNCMAEAKDDGISEGMNQTP